MGPRSGRVLVTSRMISWPSSERSKSSATSSGTETNVRGGGDASSASSTLASKPRMSSENDVDAVATRRRRDERDGAQGERVVGRTPGEPHLMDSVAHDANVSSSRIEEVRSYLSTRFGEDEAAWPRFAIVDDKQVVPEDGHAWSDRFVKTTHDAGLTDERAEALRAALRAPATVVSR